MFTTVQLYIQGDENGRNCSIVVSVKMTLDSAGDSEPNFSTISVVFILKEETRLLNTPFAFLEFWIKVDVNN